MLFDYSITTVLQKGDGTENPLKIGISNMFMHSLNHTQSLQPFYINDTTVLSYRHYVRWDLGISSMSS